MYTSGTTGMPKGVMHTHGTALWAVLTIDATADQHFGDRYLVALPLFHVGALTPAVAACYAGVTQVVMRTFDPVRAWQLIGEEQVTTGLLVPAMLQFMLQTRAAAGDVEIGQLRWIMSGASPVPVNLIQAYAELGIEIHQVYGLTESCGPACLISPDEALTRAGSTGKEFFFTRVRVVDEQGEDVPPGEPGEVICQGAHVMTGYWNRPAETAATIVDGWLHTGDVAIVDKDGYVYIHDRIKDMIISGGENIYPAEIENVLLGHPSISDVAVIGQRSERWGEVPLAVVVRTDDSVTEADVLAFGDGKLARYKQPAVGRVRRRDPAQPVGQGAQADPPRPVPRPRPHLTRPASSHRRVCRAPEGLRAGRGAGNPRGQQTLGWDRRQSRSRRAEAVAARRGRRSATTAIRGSVLSPRSHRRCSCWTTTPVFHWANASYQPAGDTSMPVRSA